MKYYGPSELTGLTPSHREWWNAAIRIQYRHARRFLRVARDWWIRLKTLLNLRKPPVRRVQLSLDSFLFALSVVQRAKKDAAYLRRMRDAWADKNQSSKRSSPSFSLTECDPYIYTDPWRQ